MDYKILQIDSGALKKVTIGAKANPETILSVITLNDDKSHTEEYYLIVSVLVEYAGERGTVVDDTTFKVMSATYNKQNLCTGVTTYALPTKEEIIAAADVQAQKWVAHVDCQTEMRAVVESTRNTIDTYGLPQERYLHPGFGV